MCISYLQIINFSRSKSYPFPIREARTLYKMEGNLLLSYNTTNPRSQGKCTKLVDWIEICLLYRKIHAEDRDALWNEKNYSFLGISPASTVAVAIDNTWEHLILEICWFEMAALKFLPFVIDLLILLPLKNLSYEHICHK